MISYKQDVKHLSRELVWRHAIESLTDSRPKAAIISEEWLRPAWDQAASRLLQLGVALDREPLDRLLRTARRTYGSRQPQDLRVAYLCGPEPENDLNVLLKLGVEMSNVWAVDSEKQVSDVAIRKAQREFPDLKIFPGTFESFAEVTDERFDIVYLDLCGEFLSKDVPPFRAIHSVLARRVLAPLGCLVTNLTVPDFTDHHHDFFAAYFWAHGWIEKSALGRDYFAKMTDDWLWTDGPIAHGIDDPKKLAAKIAENPEGAYSAFLTNYPLVFASEVLPWIRLWKSPAARSLLLSATQKQVDERWARLWCMPDGRDLFGGDIAAGSSSYALSSFLEQAKTNPIASKFLGEYQREGWIKAVQLRDIVVFSLEGFDGLLSDRFRRGLQNTISALPDRRGGVFTDVPLRNIWAQFSAFQLGYPWHPNLSLHRRYEYTSRTRTMYLDVHILDQARPLYDHFGLVDLLGDGITDIAKQVALRSGIDSIHKHGGHVLSEVYFGGNIAALGITGHPENLLRRQKLLECPAGA